MLLLCVVTAAYQIPSGNLIRDIEIVRSLLPFNTSMLLFPLCIMTFAHNHKHLTCYNECCYGDGGLVQEVNERLENKIEIGQKKMVNILVADFIESYLSTKSLEEFGMRKLILCHIE